ncbi:MAG: hypothetical protein CL917_02235 [Deltaproteobacteria bacterium]|nr:hypothetical protein [Deltaproteobacteria bacterium]
MSDPSLDEKAKRDLIIKNWGLERPAIGISIGGASNVREWQASKKWVERAEKRNLHSVWLPEMHFAANGSTSPLLYLATLAAHTQKIKLATTSLLLPIHNPIRVAEEIASLDQISKGRVIISLGRGFRPALFSAFGLDPRKKRDRFDAALDIMLSAWRGESIDLTGTPFEGENNLHGPLLEVPYQSPHPPLAVAAFGEKGLAQAARRGLPYFASPMETFEQIKDNLELHRNGLPDQITSGHAIVPIMRTVFVCPTDASKKKILSALESESRPPGVKPNTQTPKVIERALSAPIEERVVVGQIAEVTDRLSRYRDELGMNLMVIRPQVSGTTDSERTEALEMLLEEVWPSLC